MKDDKYTDLCNFMHGSMPLGMAKIMRQNMFNNCRASVPAINYPPSLTALDISMRLDSENRAKKKDDETEGE